MSFLLTFRIADALEIALEGLGNIDKEYLDIRKHTAPRESIFERFTFTQSKKNDNKIARVDEYRSQENAYLKDI